MNNKTISTQWHFCVPLLLVLILPACGGSSEVEDVTAPIVDSTSPQSDAVDVERSSNITAIFNEDIFALTIDSASFTLTRADDSSVSGNVSFDSMSNEANFSADSKLGMLATYTATLNTAITDLSGNALDSNYTWSFTTEDGTWNAAAEEIDGEDYDASKHQIAVDKNGNAMAVWKQYDSVGTRGTTNIWSNYYDGTSWGTAELLEIDDYGDAEYPQVAFDSSGNALAIWVQEDSTSYAVMTNYFDGSNWSGAEKLQATVDSRNPQVAFDGNGNALAVWGEFDGMIYNVASKYYDGSSWDGYELIETGDDSSADEQIAFDSNGNALAVWSQTDGAVYSIWSNYYDGSDWGTATLVETADTGGARYPKIDFDSNGNAIAVWSQSNGAVNNIWSNYYDGSSWGIATLLDADSDGKNAYAPQIAFDNNGNAMAVWEHTDTIGLIFNVWVSYFDGRDWGAAELLEIDDGDADDPQIAFDSSGNALAVWHQFDGAVNSIWSNRYDGSSWAGAELIETDESGDAENPQIAVDTNGNALAIWHQNDGIRKNIMINRFE